MGIISVCSFICIDPAANPEASIIFGGICSGITRVIKRETCKKTNLSTRLLTALKRLLPCKKNNTRGCAYDESRAPDWISALNYKPDSYSLQQGITKEEALKCLNRI